MRNGCISFSRFLKIKNNDHTIDTYSRFQWASALSSERADSISPHLLETMAAMGIPTQIKTDNVSAYVSSKMKQFFLCALQHKTHYRDTT